MVTVMVSTNIVMSRWRMRLVASSISPFLLLPLELLSSLLELPRPERDGGFHSLEYRRGTSRTPILQFPTSPLHVEVEVEVELEAVEELDLVSTSSKEDEEEASMLAAFLLLVGEDCSLPFIYMCMCCEELAIQPGSYCYRCLLSGWLELFICAGYMHACFESR